MIIPRIMPITKPIKQVTSGIYDFRFAIADFRLRNQKSEIVLVPRACALEQRKADEHAKDQADDETNDKTDHEPH